MSKETDTAQYQFLRSVIRSEINRGCGKPFSFEVYKKTPDEKLRLKVAKAEHKEYLKRLKGLV